MPPVAVICTPERRQHYAQGAQPEYVPPPPVNAPLCAAEALLSSSTYLSLRAPTRHTSMASLCLALARSPPLKPYDLSRLAFHRQRTQENTGSALRINHSPAAPSAATLALALSLSRGRRIPSLAFGLMSEPARVRWGLYVSVGENAPSTPASVPLSHVGATSRLESRRGEAVDSRTGACVGRPRDTSTAQVRQTLASHDATCNSLAELCSLDSISTTTLPSVW